MKQFYYLVMIIAFTGCTLNTGAPIYSVNVEEYKSVKSSIDQYKFSISNIKYEGVEIEIEDAWVEYFWEYENIFKRIKIGDEKRLIIRVNYKNDVDYWNGQFPLKKGENGITSLGSSNRGAFKYIVGLENYLDTIPLKFWSQDVLFTTK